jgi:hypothetical protein
MKKFFGVWLCSVVAYCAVFAGLCVQSSLPKSQAAIQEGLIVNYTDDYKLRKEDPVRLNGVLNSGGFMEFPDYDGCGAYVDNPISGGYTWGTFTLTLDGQSVENQEWVEVYYGATLADSQASEDDILDSLGTSVGYSYFDVAHENRPTLVLNYWQVGVYRILIITDTGESTFYIAAKIETPVFGAVYSNFPAYETNEVVWYSNKSTEIGLEYRWRTAHYVSDSQITSFSLDGKLAEFMEIKRALTDDGAIDFKKLVLTKKSGVKIINGTYEVNFIVSFDSYDNVSAQGGLVIGTPSNAVSEVAAVLNFKTSPPGYQFPFLELFICLLIIGGMYLLWRGINWLINQLTQHHELKIRIAKEERAQNEQNNLEVMRSSMIARQDENKLQNIAENPAPKHKKKAK